jgi:hypothetical protein
MSRLGIIAVLPLRGISYLNTTHPSTIIYNLSTTKECIRFEKVLEFSMESG